MYRVLHWWLKMKHASTPPLVCGVCAGKTSDLIRRWFCEDVKCDHINTEEMNVCISWLTWVFRLFSVWIYCPLCPCFSGDIGSFFKLFWWLMQLQFGLRGSGSSVVSHIKVLLLLQLRKHWLLAFKHLVYICYKRKSATLHVPVHLLQIACIII